MYKKNEEKKIILNFGIRHFAVCVIFLNIFFITQARSASLYCEANFCRFDPLSVNQVDFNTPQKKFLITGVTSINDNTISINTSNTVDQFNLLVNLDLSKRDPNSIFSMVPTPVVSVQSDLSSTDNADSSNLVFIGSILNDLTMRSDGKSGINGKSSSELCALAFKAGTAPGGLGQDLLNFWISHYPLSTTKCDQAAIDKLYSSFSCPPSYTLATTGSYSVNRFILRRKCFIEADTTFVPTNSTCPFGYGSQGIVGGQNKCVRPSNEMIIGRSEQCLNGYVDLGLFRDNTDQIEAVNCSLDTNCDIDFEKKEYEKNLLVVQPTPGTKYIAPGNTVAFLYNLSTEHDSNFKGVNGVGGKADLTGLLPSPVSQVKYCRYVRDLLTETDPNSIYRTNPYLSIHKILWNPVIQGVDSVDGFNPAPNTNGTTIIKGLDASVRYWLKNDIFNQN